MKAAIRNPADKTSPDTRTPKQKHTRPNKTMPQPNRVQDPSITLAEEAGECN